MSILKSVLKIGVPLAVTAAAIVAAKLHEQESNSKEQPHGNAPIIVALGDSITFGDGVKATRKTDCWEAKLEKLLNGNYQVLNYGVCGATLQNEGDQPYYAAEAGQQSFPEAALSLNPEIVIFMLGTNDTKPYNWNRGRFEAQLDQRVKEIKAAPSVKRLILRYNVYTQDTKKTIAALKKAAQEYSDIFTLSAYSPSQKQIAHYQKKQKERASGSRLIMVAAILVSLFIIYFTIKSNVTSRTEELTVYRLIGIAQGSIIKAYLLEMLLITSYTVLPTVLIVSGVIQFFGSIPSLELGLIFPWWTSVALIAALYVLNLLISYIPVKGILAKPPAVLAVKE